MIQLISNTLLLFWDFDGVIKESIDVKTQAFVQLFQSYGSEMAERVRKHHEANGGMSRFEKLPIYLRWCGEEPSEEKVSALCDQFSRLVMHGVIHAPWVPGAETYLRLNSHKQIFVLVSATPQEEIKQILQALDLLRSFTNVFGAPTSKKDAIRMTLDRYKIAQQRCLMIGDAKADMEAAMTNYVPFLLRRHGTNRQIFKQYTGNSVEDFKNL
jgi:phosphoglycolate phosphatase-like HAD superfamily hydrolase